MPLHTQEELTVAVVILVGQIANHGDWTTANIIITIAPVVPQALILKKLRTIITGYGGWLC